MTDKSVSPAKNLKDRFQFGNASYRQAKNSDGEIIEQNLEDPSRSELTGIEDKSAKDDYELVHVNKLADNFDHTLLKQQHLYSSVANDRNTAIPLP